MPDEQLPKHGLWFFGVILGLAIKEGLTHVVPHILNPSFVDYRALYSEMGRLVLFLLLAIRFYLGAVRHFQRPITNFGTDFFFGFVHFLFFFALALSIDVHGIPKHWFPVLLALILSYDLAWFSVSKSARRFIKVWTFVNVGTVIVSALVYLIISVSFHDPMTAEQAAYAPIGIVSIIDMLELTEKRKIFSRWFSRLGDEED